METIIGTITVLGLVVIGYFLFKRSTSKKVEDTPIGPGYPKPPEEEGKPLEKNQD